MRHTRAGFEHIPRNLYRAELFRYFTFPEPDRNEITQCRGESNKIGFALLLGGVRLTGRFLQDFELVPRSLLVHICEQLNCLERSELCQKDGRADSQRSLIET
jgi:hypothetical protein